MECGDITTITLNKQKGGSSFLLVYKREWLEYNGYTEKELAEDEIQVVAKADISERKKFRFLGFGKPEKK